MAKAREIPGLKGQDSFRAAAAKVVTTRGDELFEQAHGVLDTSDIERVHDMRVASRRLRAVLEIFGPCFPKELHRSVLHDVKALADALGERRDPDVHIASLTAFAAAVPGADRAGVESLIDRLGEEQVAANVDLAAALVEMERSDLQGKLRALAAGAATS
jgi:CHAD domain-containing protein